MRPTRIPGADPQPLGAPPDWNKAEHGECGALFIRREQRGSMQVMRSAWEVDPREATLLYAGAKLQLGISGSCHPVVELQVADLPEDFDPVVHARRYHDENGTEMCRVECLYPHGGGRRVFAKVVMRETLAATVAHGIENCEALAREQGWMT